MKIDSKNRQQNKCPDNFETVLICHFHYQKIAVNGLNSIPMMRIRVKTDIDEKSSNISLGISGEQENSGNGTYWALLQHFFPFKWRVFTEECGAHFQVQKFLSTSFEAMLC